MPDTTRSIGPNTPSRANITHSPGGPVTAHASSIAVDRGRAHLGVDHVQRAERGAGAGVLAVRGGDDDVAVGLHRPGQHVQADGVDAVVVGQQQAGHGPNLHGALRRVVPIGSDLRT